MYEFQTQAFQSGGGLVTTARAGDPIPVYSLTGERITTGLTQHGVTVASVLPGTDGRVAFTAEVPEVRLGAPDGPPVLHVGAAQAAADALTQARYLSAQVASGGLSGQSHVAIDPATGDVTYYSDGVAGTGAIYLDPTSGDPIFTTG